MTKADNNPKLAFSHTCYIDPINKRIIHCRWDTVTSLARRKKYYHSKYLMKSYLEQNSGN